MHALQKQKAKQNKTKTVKEIEIDLLISIISYVIFRNGVLHAEYLPLKIAFDPNTKRLYPKPVKNAKWINVCGKEDKQCEKC